MKFCMFKFHVVKHHPKHVSGKPKKAKLVQCELEEGHEGDHTHQKYSHPKIDKLKGR